MRFRSYGLTSLLLLAFGCAEPPGAPHDGGLISRSTDSPEARAAFEAGLEHWAHYDDAPAREDYRRAIAADSTFALAHALLSEVEPTMDERRAALRRARDLLGRTAVSDGERHWISALAAFYVDRDPDGEMAHYDTLATLYPNDPWARYLYALSLQRHTRTDYAGAVAAFDEAIRLHPDFGRNHNDRGYALIGLGDLERAEASFQRYIELEPTSFNGHDSYADAILRQGDYERSLDAYARALALKPNFPWSLLGRSANLRYLGRTDEALRTLDTLRALDLTQRERDHADRAVIVTHVAEEDWDAAEQETREQLDRARQAGSFSGRYRALWVLGEIALARGDYRDAASRLNEAVAVIRAADVAERTRRNVERAYRIRLARTALVAGEAEAVRAQGRALDDLLGEAATDEERGDVAFIDALAALAGGDAEQSAAALEALAGEPPTVQHLLYLGLSHERAGQPEQARSAYEQVLARPELNDLAYGFYRHHAKTRLDGLG